MWIPNEVPAWLQWYKKPEYRNIKDYSTEVKIGKRTLSPDGRGKTSIPSKLKLDRVLANKTCRWPRHTNDKSQHVLTQLRPPGSPMSLYDFYMYLKYIEFSAENLEFYIWYAFPRTSRWRAPTDESPGSRITRPTGTRLEASIPRRRTASRLRAARSATRRTSTRTLLPPRPTNPPIPTLIPKLVSETPPPCSSVAC